MLDESFWLAINFFIFVALAYKFLKPILLSIIDNKIKAIKSDLHDAAELKMEAEKLIQEANLIFSKIDSKCIEIIEGAHQEYQILLERYEKEYSNILINTEKGLQTRIKQSKNELLSELELALISNLHNKIIQRIKEIEVPDALEVAKKICN